jgi:hypothetical protein
MKPPNLRCGCARCAARSILVIALGLASTPAWPASPPSLGKPEYQQAGVAKSPGDLADFSELAVAFGSIVGGTGWNANADLNGDGVVDLNDFPLLSANYGLSGDP